MSCFSRYFRLVLLLLFLEGAGSLVFAQSQGVAEPLVASGRQSDLTAVFHPLNAAQSLQTLCDGILQISQILSVLVIVGGLLGRMRQDEAPFAAVAGMMVRVGVVASLSWLGPKLMETSDLLAGLVGERTIPGAKLQTSGEAAPSQLSTLQQRMADLEKQWTLSSSPFLDSLDEQRTLASGGEESWLALGWNWARRPPSTTAPAGSAWESATAAERGGLLLRVTLAVGALVQFSEAGCFLAETFRGLLFHAGFALLPLFIAGLGVDSLRTPAFRALVALVGIALWPFSWAVANVATLGMLSPALELHQKCASAALYPKLADDASRTVAMAAPYLSWSLLGFLAVVTTAICLWLLGSLFLAPWLLHKALGAGAGKVSYART